MNTLRHGYVTGPLIGALWMVITGFTVAVVLSFSTGEPFRPVFWACLVWGALMWVPASRRGGPIGALIGGLVLLAATLLGIGPVGAAFFTWDIGMKRGNLRLLGVFSYMAPLISALLLVATGQAAADWPLAIACALITGGALVAARRHPAWSSAA